jgi:hypothetical protein
LCLFHSFTYTSSFLWLKAFRFLLSSLSLIYFFSGTVIYTNPWHISLRNTLKKHGTIDTKWLNTSTLFFPNAYSKNFSNLFKSFISTCKSLIKILEKTLKNFRKNSPNSLKNVSRKNRSSVFSFKLRQPPKNKIHSEHLTRAYTRKSPKYQPFQKF